MPNDHPKHAGFIRPVLLLALTALILYAIAACTPRQSRHDPDREEWIPLFNGTDIDGWITKIHHYEPGVNYGNTFRVEDSTIKVRYDRYEGDFNDRFGHLYYKEPYSYYRLAVEYRFHGELHPGAPSYTILNSGVMFHSEDPREMPKEQNWPISVEMQFYAGLGDGNPRPTGNMCSPGTDVVYNGKIDPRHCISSSSETYPADRWVRAEAIVLGDSLITHIVEGDTVLKYARPQVGLTGVVTGYDATRWNNGTLLKEGYIALQSEGQPIDFRKVELLNLEGCTDPQSPNFKNYFVKHDPEKC